MQSTNFKFMEIISCNLNYTEMNNLKLKLFLCNKNKTAIEISVSKLWIFKPRDEVHTGEYICA